jgi:hypothetical protein
MTIQFNFENNTQIPSVKVCIHFLADPVFLSTMAQQPPVGQGLLIIEDSWSHSDTPHSVGFLWASHQAVAGTSDNTQHSQQRDILVPRGIRTHNSSKRAATDPRLRPRGHWDRTLSDLFSHNVHPQNAPLLNLIFHNIFYMTMFWTRRLIFRKRAVTSTGTVQYMSTRIVPSGIRSSNYKTISTLQNHTLMYQSVPYM